MAFDLLAEPLFWIPVTWPGLKQGEGEEALAVPTDYSIDVQVLIVERDEFIKLFKLDELRETGELPAFTDEEERALFDRLARGWRKVKAGGSPLPFTPENVSKMIQVAGFANAFGGAYNLAFQGRIEEREKNSDGSLGAGQAGEPKNETPAAKTS